MNCLGVVLAPGDGGGRKEAGEEQGGTDSQRDQLESAGERG